MVIVIYNICQYLFLAGIVHPNFDLAFTELGFKYRIFALKYRIHQTKTDSECQHCRSDGSDDPVAAVFLFL